MPLILISGYPSSGKTHRSKQLIDFFQAKISSSTDPAISRLKISHINDQSLGLSRDVYSAARSEKDARAAFSSAIKRDISRDTIVVADGMNYIKGFRYQLYCEAKAIPTTSCVIHIGTPIEQCRTLNTEALSASQASNDTSNANSSSGGYEPTLFENLIFRYEEPNGMTRWDSPLFTVPFDDPSPPSQEIWDAMVGADGKAYRAVRPNQATVLKAPSETNYLYELDRVTSEVVAAIAAWGRDHVGEEGGRVVLAAASSAPVSSGGAARTAAGEEEEGLDERGLVVELPTSQTVGLAQLQRLRRQFIAMNRTHEVGKSRIRGLFVDYLNDAFQK